MKNKVFFLVLGLLTGLFLPTPFLAQNTVITGFVWNDLNANGLQDSLEPGLPGVVVILQNASATVANSATDTTGHYTFSAIAPDSLRLQFVNPGGVMPTLQNVGTNDTIDSDADVTGLTAFFVLKDSTTVHFDAGFKALPVCLTPITATFDSIQCSDNNTPNDSTDDKFTFRLKATGGAGTWSVPPDTLFFAYDSAFVFGPYPISGGPKTLVLVDKADSLCSDTVTVTPPPPCSVPICLTPITATVDSILCNDNNTPADSTDDVYTFRLKATGGIGTWSVPPDTLFFPYDSAFVFGPYPISGGPLSLVVVDSANTICSDTVSVTPPGPCSVPLVACDVKEIGCVKFELLDITSDSSKHHKYTIQVTNNCTDKLLYTAFQLPDGVEATDPAEASTYTAPSGHQYLVRNPNFSPFYSIRYKPMLDSISGGQSDIFEYTLPPQADPTYIHAIVRIWPKTYYEVHLNTFDCKPSVPFVVANKKNFGKPYGGPPTTPKPNPGGPGTGNPTPQQQDILVYPNPAVDQLSVDLSDWKDQQVQVQLFSAQGVPLLDLSVTAGLDPQDIKLPAGLQNGIYWLKIAPAAGKPVVQRVVLQW